MNGVAINTPAWADKSLWVAVLGFLLPIVNKKLGLDLSAESIYGAIVPLVIFIVSTKWKSGMLSKAAMLAGAEASVETPPGPPSVEKVNS